MTLIQIVGVIIIISLLVLVFIPKKKTEGAVKRDTKTGKAKTFSGKSKKIGLFTKKEQPKTVQDFLDYEHIFDNGVVKLKNGTYTAMIEVTQLNNRLNNVDEKTAIWKKFRGLINAINIRQTILVQSQYLDITDFIRKFEDNSKTLGHLTPQLIAARSDVISNYYNYSERKSREYRSYIIYRFNPNKDGIEKGLQTGNSAIDSILQSIKGQKDQMAAEESEELAQTILSEITDLAYQMLYSIGIRSVRLNRVGVLNMVYGTLNRDLSVIQRLQDASDAGSFSEFKQSITPFVAEEMIKEERLHKQQQQEVKTAVFEASEHQKADQKTAEYTEELKLPVEEHLLTEASEVSSDALLERQFVEKESIVLKEDIVQEDKVEHSPIGAFTFETVPAVPVQQLTNNNETDKKVLFEFASSTEEKKVTEETGSFEFASSTEEKKVTEENGSFEFALSTDEKKATAETDSFEFASSTEEKKEDQGILFQF